MSIRRFVRRAIRRVNTWMDQDLVRPLPPSTYMYGWTNAMLHKLHDQGQTHHYAWGALQAAHLAAALGFQRVSMIEFGVSTGRSLLALDQIAQRLHRAYGTEIDVYGFDTGRGLPPPSDYRDMPNLYAQQEYAMDRDALSRKLQRAKLVIGPIEETVPRFVQSGAAPVAFVSIDVDYYSSTVAAYRLLEADYGLLLPRIYAYLDDIHGWTCSDYTGERLATVEFNDRHKDRKISLIPGLRYFLPPSFRENRWVESMYLAHFFNHPLYNSADALTERAWSERATAAATDVRRLMQSIYERL